VDNLRSGEALRWKADDHWLGRLRSVMWQAGTSNVIPLPVSVKDRWAGPREQVLNIPIAYRWYGSGKPCSRPSTEGWLYPHCFIGWLRRETRYGSTDRSAVILWIVSRALFLGSSGPAQLCWRQRKRLLCIDRVRYVWFGTICGLSVGCM
jgi:hypothetical protein